MTRAPCSVCGAELALRSDGTTRRHGRCPGAYLRPAVPAPTGTLARIVARHASPEDAIAHLLAVGLRIDPAEVRRVWEAA